MPGESAETIRPMRAGGKVVLGATIFSIGTMVVLANSMADESKAFDKTDNQDLLPPPVHVEFTSPKPIERVNIFDNLDENAKKLAEQKVTLMKQVIYNNPSFEGMRNIVLKNREYIAKACQSNNLPKDLVSAIVLIENGGAEDLTSPAGARGPTQLMPDTAGRFGLIVNEEIDQRLDPAKSFEAMGQYLSYLRDFFGGNIGLAVWAYHAGEGNVFEALRVYLADNHQITLEDDVYNADVQSKLKAFIQAFNINVHEVLENGQVKNQILSGLSDETELYLYKAVAAAEILQ